MKVRAKNQELILTQSDLQFSTAKVELQTIKLRKTHDLLKENWKTGKADNQPTNQSPPFICLLFLRRYLKLCLQVFATVETRTVLVLVEVNIINSQSCSIKGKK